MQCGVSVSAEESARSSPPVYIKYLSEAGTCFRNILRFNEHLGKDRYRREPLKFEKLLNKYRTQTSEYAGQQKQGFSSSVNMARLESSLVGA
jgi:hypothetical protein